MRTRSKCSSTNSATSRAKCSAGKRSFSAGATDNRRSGRTHGTSCSAGNFGLAELGVCALSKTYLEQLVIGELISHPSFRAPTLNPITPPGVLPTQAGTQLRYLSALDDRSSCLALLPLPARTSRRRPGLGLRQGHWPKPDRLSADVSSMQNGSPGLHTATGTHPDHCAVARHRRWWSTSSARPPTPKPS